MLNLLASQVERCNEILKRLTLNPAVEDDFIDKDLSLYDYVKEIVNSFKEISDKNFELILSKILIHLIENLLKLFME